MAALKVSYCIRHFGTVFRHIPVYLGLWLALGLAAQHAILVRIRRFGASNPKKCPASQGLTRSQGQGRGGGK